MASEAMDVVESMEVNPINPMPEEKGQVVESVPVDVANNLIPNQNDDNPVVEKSAEEIIQASVEKVAVTNESFNTEEMKVNGELLQHVIGTHEVPVTNATESPYKSEIVKEDDVDAAQGAADEQGMKYWSAVRENPQDFTSWTYLLQFVEQENKLLPARAAFDEFLKRYPFCYGYWKKFADVEKKHGNLKQAAEVFEKGVAAIPLSVDLWVHYLNFLSTTTRGRPGSASKMRSLFERAILAAGEEFRSDKLWEAYIEWEKSQQQWQRVTSLYDRVLTVPTQNYRKQWEKFQEHINTNPLFEVLGAEDLLKLKAQYGTMPPGLLFESSDGLTDSDQVDDENEQIDKPPDPETNAIREKVIELRRGLFETNELEVNKRWAFEDSIKRPYFHVKPLERAQLKNWQEYIDYEIETSSHEKVIMLFERCMIACALYEEFWQRYAAYMESLNSVEGCQRVYERACTVHIPDKPTIHLEWAVFEEKHGNVERAREILTNLDKVCPGMPLIKLRRANFERRCKEIANVCAIYENAMSENADKELGSFYAIRYARFLSKIAHDGEKAKEVLIEAIKKDEENKRLYLQLLDLELSMKDVNEEKVEEVFNMVKLSPLPDNVKEGFSQRRVEFLQDFCNNVLKIIEVREAHNKLYKITTEVTGQKRPIEEDSLEISDAKLAKTVESNSDAQVTAASVFDTSTDYSSYATTTAAYAAYTSPQWINYQAQHPGYNYAQWYQQYGQAYQQAQ